MMEKTLELYLKHFEATKLFAYQDGNDVWTIGTGATFWPDGTPVKEGDVCTPKQAMELFEHDVEYFGTAVDVNVAVPLSDNQRSALICLTYNIGTTALAESQLLKRLNAGDYGGAADQFKWWRKDGGQVIPGLVRRRISEARLFCGTPDPLVRHKNFPENWNTLFYGGH